MVITIYQLLLTALLDLPFQARPDWPDARFRPLRAGRAADIHVEGQRVLVHEIAAHAERTGVHAHAVAAFVENIGRQNSAAEVATRVACSVFFKKEGVV